MKRTSAVALILALFAPLAVADTFTWAQAFDGNWVYGSFWDLPGYPQNAGDSAVIGVAGAYTVSLDTSPSIDWLNISNAYATLHISYNYTLTLREAAGLTNSGMVYATGGSAIVGAVNNHATIWSNSGTCTITGDVTNHAGAEILAVGTPTTLVLNGPTVTNEGTILVQCSSFYTAELRFDDNVTLQGGGTLELDDTLGEAHLTTGGGCALTHAANHTVGGHGRVLANVINEGLIQADVAGTILELQTEPKTNNATMKATGGGRLRINAITITQGPGGVLQADAGSVVELLSQVTIVGGTLNTLGDGVLDCWAGTKTLTDVANLGRYELNRMSTNVVTGATFVNDGTIVVNGDDYYSSYLRFDSAVDFQGSGTIILNRRVSGAQLNTGDGVTLTHPSGHTIRGMGQINAAMVNAGGIDADVSGEALTLQTNNKSNTGTMTATNGAILSSSGIDIDNTGGAILADGGAVQLTNTTITGGTLGSAAGSEIIGYAGVTLSDVTLPEGTTYAVDYYDTTTVAGTLSTNNGMMECRSHGTLDVLADVDGTGGWYANDGVIRFNSGVNVTTAGPIQIDQDDGRVEVIAADVGASDLRLDKSGRLTVGGSLTLSGDLDFAATNEGKWIWDPAATLTMTGTSDLNGCHTLFWSTLEVGDRDNGTGGPDSNRFDITNLALATNAVVTLVDKRDNGNGLLESLYVETLTLATDAVLNLNGLHLYVHTGPDYTLMEVGPYGSGEIIDQPVLLIGDVNTDGVVNGFDIDVFVAVLIGEDTDPDHVCAADCNADGDVNGFDIDPFVALLQGG